MDKSFFERKFLDRSKFQQLLFEVRKYENEDIEGNSQRRPQKDIFVFVARRKGLSDGMVKNVYRRGFFMEPYQEYQCANCLVKFGSSYPKYIKVCPSCGAEFLTCDTIVDSKYL